MNFPDAIKSGFKNYVTFSGRATRSEYWYFVLFVILVRMAANILDVALFDAPFVPYQLAAHPLAVIAGLALLLPMISVGARRLHDIDRSGWWLLLWLLPIIGTIIVLIWLCTKGTLGSNRFGADPLP